MKKRTGTGLIHIYYGDGKGKTTAGVGLVIRAAGYGYRVLVYQFMKDNRSSERRILGEVGNITLVDGLDEEKFSAQLTTEQRKERKKFYEAQFQKVTGRAVSEGYDVLFLDEVIYAVSAGLLEEKLLLDFLKEKPDTLEVVLTGNTPQEALLAEADYVSQICKVKHPFEEGQEARMGIEK